MDWTIRTRLRSARLASSWWCFAWVRWAGWGRAFSSTLWRVSLWRTEPDATCWSPPPPETQPQQLSNICTDSNTGLPTAQVTPRSQSAVWCLLVCCLCLWGLAVIQHFRAFRQLLAPWSLLTRDHIMTREHTLVSSVRSSSASSSVRPGGRGVAELPMAPCTGASDRLSEWSTLRPLFGEFRLISGMTGRH